VVLATDRKVVDGEGSNRIVREECKYSRLADGRTFMGVTGIAYYTPTKFYPIRIASGAMRPDMPFEAALSQIAEQIESAFRHTLTVIASDAPSNIMAVCCAFISIQGDVPVSAVLTFRPEREGDGFRVQTKQQFYNSDWHAFACGYNNNMRRFLRQYPDDWRDDLIGSASGLVELEIARNSEYVGFPIDIVSITKLGTQQLTQFGPQHPEISRLLD
jgi:hypothetical protein